jgi:hypothetical protein
MRASSVLLYRNFGGKYSKTLTAWNYGRISVCRGLERHDYGRLGHAFSQYTGHLTSGPLADEARFLHNSLFSEPLDEKIVERYQAAHRSLFPNESLPTVARIVALRLDVEAVEFALRRRHACPELTRKIQILSYLVEVRAAYQDDFVATKREPVRATFVLLWRTLGSAWKLVKGECLVRFYGLL